MKQFVLPSLLLLLLVCCKKSKDMPPSISGTWEIQRYMTPWINRVYTPGNDTLIKFTLNQYQRTIDGQIIKQGTFRLIKDELLNNEMGNRIIYDGETNASREFYRIEGDRLIFSSDPRIMDGSVIYYHRIK
ncbi:hypothetical protein AAHN97_12350 [Chitinophaga niabensis]|uniref:hypothetical protein n=1 Tax=Chitinophaga niabensis TaxID=536979 RepID=UPI0031BA9331